MSRTAAVSLLGCIRSVCRKANAVITGGNALIARLSGVSDAALGLEDDLESSSSALSCVVNGAVGTTCTLPQGSTLPTLAGAIARLNATSINGVVAETFTATAGQTVFTLSGAPAGSAYLEIAVNGALCSDPADYSVSGTTLTFVYGLTLGDHVLARRFSVS